MLANIKNDLLYLLNMIEGIEKIFIYSNNFKNAEEFFEYNEQLNFNATLNLFGLIGENAGKISKELKDNYNKLEWQKLKDFRNKVVHDYVNLDVFIVFKIIKEELKNSKEYLEKIVKEELKSGNFSKEEYEISKNSIYYKHINYAKLDF